MRVISTIAIIGSLTSAVVVVPTAGIGHAAASTGCVSINLGGFEGDSTDGEFFAGEQINLTARQVGSGPPPSRIVLEVNGVPEAARFPGAIVYDVDSAGEYTFSWSANGGALFHLWCVPADPADADGDAVPDADDSCDDTVLPDEPLVELKPNRFGADERGEFIDGDGNSAGIMLFETAGCSAAQIIARAGLGNGHSKFGLSKGALTTWLDG